jgi:uncharacterized protein YkwD
VNRCLTLLVASAATLLLALPSAAEAASPHTRHGTVHVRHQAIHSPARKGAKRSCPRRKAHKLGKAHRLAKRTSSCRKQKRGAHRKRKHVVRHVHANPHPATASRDCPNANLTPKQGNVEIVVEATLCLVNGERARFGESALIEDGRLADAATGHSRDMDVRHYFEHVSPGGQTLLMRVRASGFIPSGHIGYTLGENIAWGTLWLGTPHAIVKAWMASPGHRANILNRSYRYTGIGIDASLPRSMSSGQAGGMYTQDFGTVTG